MSSHFIVFGYQCMIEFVHYDMNKPKTAYLAPKIGCLLSEQQQISYFQQKISCFQQKISYFQSKIAILLLNISIFYIS